MTIKPLAAAALLALGLAATPGLAQDGPIGIAVVAAPEAGSGTCFAADAAKGFKCAAKICKAEAGEQGDQCVAVLWCFPSLYAADLVVNNSDGFTYHQYLCGVQDRGELVDLARAKCTGAATQGANACAIGAAFDPDGKPLTIEDDIRTAAPAN